MHRVARSSSLGSAGEDKFIFGILKQNYRNLENTSQVSVHIMVHPYFDSVTDIINVTILILRIFDVSLLSPFSRNGIF